ncbi:hypothetical protein ABT294_36995 [Nonomuraea sp. NPDC000554]|uniref:hypothetical protein n=1 Tax=Nonomuraea sp. NPDC000554 TaxID=3154259 RepID=UPI00331D6000
MRIAEEKMAGLELAKQRLLGAHGDDRNCVGFAIGFRERGGVRSDEPVVTVMVAKKRPEGFVSGRRLLPRTVTVDGVEHAVDVVETGVIRAGRATLDPPVRTLAARSITERMRPARQGCGVANLRQVGNWVGTFGCVVRDRTDQSLCILSNSHVLARGGMAESDGKVIPEEIVQPGTLDNGGAADVIAKLKRFVPFGGSKDQPNETDAAIAQVLDSSLVSVSQVARDLMAPPSAAHPAIGLCFAGSDQTGVGFVVRIAPTLSGLNVEMLSPGSTAEVDIDDHIEKVGRTTGYTSSKVFAINAVVRISMEEPKEDFWFRCIATRGFLWAGDSGSLVCRGGDGKTTVPPEKPIPCNILDSLGGYYDLPLVGDSALADKARDSFLYQSQAGQLIGQLFYINSQVIIDRVRGKEGTDTEKSYAATYYKKYHDFIANLLANPNSTAVITQENLNDVAFIITGLEQSLLTPEESNAATTLFNDVMSPTLGMNRAQVIAYMNTDAVYHKVLDAVAKAPTLETNAWVGVGH